MAVKLTNNYDCVRFFIYTGVVDKRDTEVLVVPINTNDYRQLIQITTKRKAPISVISVESKITFGQRSIEYDITSPQCNCLNSSTWVTNLLGAKDGKVVTTEHDLSTASGKKGQARFCLSNIVVRYGTNVSPPLGVKLEQDIDVK